jgi:Spy/CpxP family protein refolding chaperone
MSQMERSGGELACPSMSPERRRKRRSIFRLIVSTLIGTLLLAFGLLAFGAMPASAAGSSSPVATSPCGVGDDYIPPADSALSTAKGTPTGIMASGAGQFAITSMCLMFNEIDLTSSPELTGANQSGNWLSSMLIMMRDVALWTMGPIILMALIQAIFRGSLNGVLKIFLVYVPLAVVGGVVATGLAQLFISMTDDFSKGFVNSISANAGNAFTGISDGFGPDGVEQGIPFFIIIITGFLVGFACMSVFILLIVREASVYLAAAFMPIGLIFLIWPSMAHFFKRMLEFLLAMIFSKLVIAAAMALVVAAVAASAASIGGAPWYTWLAQTMTLIVMFFFVANVPHRVHRMLSGLALNHASRAVGEAAEPFHGSRFLVALDRNLTNISLVNDLRNMGRARRQREAWANDTHPFDNALDMVGVSKGADGTTAISNDAMTALGTEAAMRPFIYRNSRSNNYNEKLYAHAALHGGTTGWDTSRDGVAILYAVGKGSRPGVRGEATIVGDLVDNATGQLRNGMSPMQARILADQLLNDNWDVRLLVPYDSGVQIGPNAEPTLMDRNQAANAAQLNAAMNELTNERRAAWAVANPTVPYSGPQAGFVGDAPASARDYVAAGHTVGGAPGYADY